MFSRRSRVGVVDLGGTGRTVKGFGGETIFRIHSVGRIVGEETMGAEGLFRGWIGLTVMI